MWKSPVAAALGKPSYKALIQFTEIYGFYESEVKSKCAASL